MGSGLWLGQSARAGVQAGGISCPVRGKVSTTGMVKVGGDFGTTHRLSIWSFLVTDQSLLLPERWRHCFGFSGHSPRRP